MKFSVFLYILLAVLLQSCAKPDCFESAGPVVTVQRAASPFHQIDLYHNINLILTQDSTETITVQAGQNLQPNITTSIEKGVLTIKNTTTCTWLRNPAEKITVTASVKKLQRLNYNGSGHVTSTNTLQTDTVNLYSKQGAGIVDLSLNAEHTTVILQQESADFILHGSSNYCATYVDSRGSINFKDFKVKRMDIGYTSVRNSSIHVLETLYATTYHTGNVYYQGSPYYVHTTYYSTGRAIALP